MQLTRKQIFLAKLGACSLGAHMVLLFSYFFIFHDRVTHHINFTMPANIKFVYMPFQKRVQSAAGASAGAVSGSDVQVAQTAKSTKTVMSKRGGTKKAKKRGGKKKQLKKVEKKIEAPAPEVFPVVATNTDVPATSEPFAIGQQELDAIEMAESIRQEVVRVWHPPLGLAQGRQCKVKVLIDWQGAVQELQVEESSQVPAFDASVKLALRDMKFPKSVYGKELILPFGA